MKWVLLVLLAGCAAHGALPQEAMEPCQDAVLPPKAPKQPVPKANLAAWSIQIQLAREETARRLDECSKRHDELSSWIKSPK